MDHSDTHERAVLLSDDVMDRFRLTEKEREVVQLLLDGLRTKQIADALCNSPETIKSHVGHIREKTGSHDTAGIVRSLWSASLRVPSERPAGLREEQ